MNTFLRDLRKSILRKNPALAAEVDTRWKALHHLEPDSFEALVGILKQTGVSSPARSAACWLLAQGKHRQAATALWRVFTEDDRNLIWESAKALAQLKPKSLAPRLISSLQSSSIEHRCAAAYTLGMMREPGAIKYLEKMLVNREESPKVRGHAAEALAYLRDRRSLAALLTALSDRSPEVRWWAAFALGELGDKRALPELERVAVMDRGRLRGGRSVSKEARSAFERLSQRVIQ